MSTMSIYEFGPFALDAQRLLLLENDQPVPLGPKVVETLLALVEHPGDVLTKTALLERIWPEGYVDEANLAQNIYVLRKTLRARWEASVIETIPRRGYRFVGAVRCREEREPAQPVLAEPAAPVPVPAAPVSVKPQSHFNRWVIAVAAIVVILLAGTMAFTLARPRPAAAAAPLSAEGKRLYEIGRYYWNLRTPDGLNKSIAYFSHVIDTDPGNASGYAALASANAILADYQFGPLQPSVYFERARAYAHHALAIDPNSGEAYAVLGMVSSEESTGSQAQMAQSLRQLQRAIQIDPRSGPAHEWYGIMLLELGQIGMGYTELQKAADLDPLSVATMVWLSNAARLEHHYDDAISYARETLDLSPNRHDAYESLGLSYEALGNRSRAIEAFREMANGCGTCRWEAAALLAEIYAHTDRIAEARMELALAEAHSGDVKPENLAVALAAVGKKHVALEVLRHTSGEYLRTLIARDPRFAVFGTEQTALRKPA
jgi:DNA-binding winged helix-turn-helix (wHTH) protein/Flp pilus assembly protein TadD